MTRRAAFLACALLLGLPTMASAATGDDATCAFLAVFDRACVAVHIRGESQGCFWVQDGGNNSTGQHRECAAIFYVAANATSWPVPGGLRMLLDDMEVGACSAAPDCHLGGGANATFRVLVDPPPGLNVLTLRIRGIVEQPATGLVAGIRSPALLATEADAEASVVFDV